MYLRDKEGKLLIPPNAFSKSPDEYTSGIVASDYRLSSDVALILDTNKGPVEIKLFDRIFPFLLFAFHCSFLALGPKQMFY